MQDLIERLEKAKGPDRNLDGTIAALIIHPRSWPEEWRNGEFLPYTDSLDAALTLKADNAWFCLSGPHNANGGRWREGQERSFEVVMDDKKFDGAGSTPAIAACICFLKARAAGKWHDAAA